MSKAPKNDRLAKAFSLFTTFFKIGAFTFGGGYAMIPLIQREIVEKHKWLDEDDIMSVIAISESTPGPVAINMATFVGYRTAGVLGSAMATIGVVLPSFVIILLISGLLREFYNSDIVRYAFYGIRAGVLALIAKALWALYKKCPHSLFSYILMLAALIVVAFFKVSALIVIISCAVCGLLYSIITTRREKQ